MLVISDRALDVFSRQAESNFDRKAYSFLAEQFPDLLAVRGQDGLQLFVVAGQNRASLAGCRSEQEIMLFISLQAMFGEDFDIVPHLAGATAPLHEHATPLSARLDEVYSRLTGANSRAG